MKVAVEHMEAEVFVVDNNSVDGSVEMVQDRFPWVMLIANKENTGFSVANNQAIKESKGEYVLLLNPDTLVEADTFEKTVGFMDAHLEAGGLGVRMVDGKGDFLPESKRSLPTPEVAFYKIFGLSSFFPKSKRFGKYHLGFLDELLQPAHDIVCQCSRNCRSRCRAHQYRRITIICDRDHLRRVLVGQRLVCIESHHHDFHVIW